MNPSLKEINEIYLQIQDFIDPPLEYFDRITKEQRLDFVNKRNEYLQKHENTLRKLQEILSRLSPGDIIEGYQHGCRMLQISLAGHMFRHFSEMYIPLMIDAIKKDNRHTAPIFLRALSVNTKNKEQIGSLALTSLNSQWQSVIDAALSVVYELRVVAALPKIKEFAKGTDPAIAELAKNILDAW